MSLYLGALQATRALMIVSIIVTLAGLGVACMGMKCTNCGGDDKTRKSRIAMTGGIIILIGGKNTFKFVFSVFARVLFLDFSSNNDAFLFFFFFAFSQLCVPLLPAPGTHTTSSRPSTTLSPLSIPSEYMRTEAEY